MFSDHWVLADKNKTTPTVKKHYFDGGNFTARLSVKYEPSLLSREATWQALAISFETGRHFHFDPVILVGDGKLVELGHTIKANTQ